MRNALYLLLFVPIIGFILFYNYGTDEIIKCTLDSKERIVEKSGEGTSSKYLVFCEEEVLENTDSFWYLKYSSSDVYRDLKEGQVYDLRVYGWRIPFFSQYRNIIEIK